MLAGCYFESARLLRLCLPHDAVVARPRLPGWLVLAAVITTALPTFNCLQRGQTGILKLYLLLLGLRLAIEAAEMARSQPGHRTAGVWRSIVAGIVLAMPISLKITPLLPVGFLWAEQWLASRRQDAPQGAAARAVGGLGGTLAGLLLCLFIVPSLMVGWQENQLHLTQWWNRVGNKAHQTGYDRFAGDSYSVKNQSLSNALHHLGNWTMYQFAGGPHDLPFENEKTFIPDFATDKPPFERMLMVLRGAVVALVGLLGWRSMRSREPLALAAGFGLAAVATLIAAPVARAHYFVLALPAAAVRAGVALAARAGNRRLVDGLDPRHVDRDPLFPAQRRGPGGIPGHRHHAVVRGRGDLDAAHSAGHGSCNLGSRCRTAAQRAIRRGEIIIAGRQHIDLAVTAATRAIRQSDSAGISCCYCRVSAAGGESDPSEN